MEDDPSAMPITPMVKIFETLSSLMSVFKKLFALLQKISTLKSRAFPIDQSVQQINKIFNQVELLIVLIPENPTQQCNKTFQRFMCRIIETVHFNRHKFMELGMSSLLIQLTNQLENNFLGFSRQNNLPMCIRKSLKIVNKYYKINPEVSPRKASLNSRKNIQDKNFYATIGPLQQFRSKKIQYKSDSNLSRVMIGINKYFHVTSCLVLDYQSLRNTCFQANSKSKDLYDDIMERNYLISQAVAQYSKDFKQYLKRKQQRKAIFRKSKFIENQSNFHTNHLFQPQKSSLRFKQQFSRNTISNFKAGYFAKKKNSQRILVDQINLEQVLQQNEVILSQNNSPNRLKGCKRGMVSLAMQQRAKNFYQMKQVVISASKVKLNINAKNGRNLNQTIWITDSHNKNRSQAHCNSGDTKQRKGSNPSELYVSRLKKNLQKIRNSNNILIRMEKEQTAPGFNFKIQSIESYQKQQY